MRLATLLLSAVVLAWTDGVQAAETGDFDGDGRLSIGDVLHLEAGGAPAPGSLDGFGSHPCWDSDRIGTSLGNGDEPLWNRSAPRMLTLLEALRRSVDTPLALWEDPWGTPQDSRRQEPLAPTPSVRVRLGSAVCPGAESDVARLELVLETLEPIRGFALVIESGGLLAAPFARASWGYSDWWRPSSFEWEAAHRDGDLTVMVSPAASLVTRGRYAMTSSLRQELIEPGTYRLVATAHVRRGTPAGERPLTLLGGSEIVLADGGLAAPVVEGTWSLVVEREVTSGRDGDDAPLELDESGRRVLGAVEFRLLDRRVSPPRRADLVSLAPGEALPLRVQVRTETPLNRIAWDLRWPGGRLLCGASAIPLLADVVSGDLLQTRELHCVDSFLSSDGSLRGEYIIGGAEASSRGNLGERPLEHFRPLGEWVDLADVTLTAATDAARGEEIPLVFARRAADASAFSERPRAEFVPFSARQPCDDGDGELPDNWGYDIRFGDATIEPGEITFRSGVFDAVAVPGGKRIVDGAYGAARAVRAGTLTITAEAFRRGDADANGALEVTDPLVTLNYLFRGDRAPGCADAADANDDGVLDIADPTLVLSVLFRGVGVLPAPHPQCGVDPTPDELDCGRGCGT